MLGWLRRWFTSPGRPSAQTRERGAPPSANGASSLHLSWDLPGAFAEVSVTLEVLEPPTVDRLYFWALQAGFVDRASGRDAGAAHLGLQWHPDYPNATAANWGGYRAGGAELSGTRLVFPSALGNPNTCNFAWHATRPYRLTIARAADNPRDWLGKVADLHAGTTTVLRALHTEGTHLQRVMMWSEVFARCDQPPAAVRWSDPQAIDDRGGVHRPTTVSVNYQAYRDGGCTNTCSFADNDGLVQRTNTARVTPQGATLPV